MTPRTAMTARWVHAARRIITRVMAHLGSTKNYDYCPHNSIIVLQVLKFLVLVCAHNIIL